MMLRDEKPDRSNGSAVGGGGVLACHTPPPVAAVPPIGLRQAVAENEMTDTKSWNAAEVTTNCALSAGKEPLANGMFVVGRNSRRSNAGSTMVPVAAASTHRAPRMRPEPPVTRAAWKVI